MSGLADALIVCSRRPKRRAWPSVTTLGFGSTCRCNPNRCLPTVEVGFTVGLGNSVIVSFLRELDVEVMTIVWPSFKFCPSNARTFCASLAVGDFCSSGCWVRWGITGVLALEVASPRSCDFARW